MNIYIVLTIGIVLSVLFHFIGVYAQAKKVVWVMLLLIWAGSIGFAMNEISPKGYAYIDKLKGEYPEVDVEIERALPEISLYELLSIRKAYEQEKSASH